MADNVTTYTAVINTEVKGADDLDKLGEGAEEAADGFVKLQIQIKQTQKDLQAAAAAGDKAKFNQLRKQLDDLEEGLEKVSFQSKQFDDQLASLPGPAGAAGNALKGMDGMFKMLLANPIIALIAGIAGALMLMKKSLSSTAEGQQTLNRLSQAFSSILGPILATVEKVAVPLFNGFAFVLEKVAEGFNKFAKFLGISESKIKEATLSVDEVQQKANEAETKRQEELTKKTEAEQKKREENARKAAEARKKREEEERKQAEERQKNLDAANKVQTEAYIATLEERDKELYRLGQQHNERMLALEKAGVTDKSAVLEQYRIEAAAINKKYDDEAAKKVEEDKKKKEEDDKKAAEDARTKFEKDKEDQLLKVESQLEFDNLTFEQRKALIDEKERVLLSDKELTEGQRTAIQKAAAQERANIDMAELEAKAEIQNAYADLAGQFGSLLQQIAGKSKGVAIAGVIIEQISAISKIVSNTAVANAKAVAALPVTGGQPFVTINTISAALGIASTIASAAKSIQQIKSTNESSTASSGGGASLPKTAGGGGGGNLAAPTLGGIAAPVIQGTQAATPGAQIAQTIGAASGRPIVAQIVSSQVSSQQALDRRTNVAATFGGV